MRKAVVVFLVSILFILLGLFLNSINQISVNDIKVSSIKYNHEAKLFKIKFSLSSNNLYCGVTDDISKVKWKQVKGNICDYSINSYGKYDFFIKYGSDVRKIDVNKVFYTSIDKSKYYMAIGDKKKLLYDYVSIGNGVTDIISSDNSVVYVKDNIMYAKGNGKVVISVGDKKIDVVSTKLISPIPKKYNYKRSYLTCDLFSLNDAKLLDEILDFRVREAGNATRAGVVAAARFITLEFPYRISYFSENGRLTVNGVDGEGRYYHKGLYLTEDKFSSIGKASKGPTPWGCYVYSKPSKGQRRNGLDCSGFTTWVVLNGGFDIGDYGAHGKGSSSNDLNQFGKEVKLTHEVAMSNKIKAGDLLGEVSVSEGHSAIVVGVDKNNYYVAESLWINPLGVNINTYKKRELANHFETVNLMDSYYKKDGNYTAMWY